MWRRFGGRMLVEEGEARRMLGRTAEKEDKAGRTWRATCGPVVTLERMLGIDQGESTQ